MEAFALVKNFIRKVSEASEENTDSDTSENTVVAKVRINNCSNNSTATNTIQSDQLIGVLRERNSNANNVIDATKRHQICIEPKAKTPFAKELSTNYVQVQVHQQIPIDRNYTTEICSSNAPGKQKIPRPANAFMLFANEWRKKLALENPKESNKDISVRLGVLWKNMTQDVKEKYFALARQVDAEHKRKYPDYVYNPKEARLRKAMREQSRELSRQTILQTTGAVTGTATGTLPGANGGGNMGVSSSGNFLNHPMACASPNTAVAAASSLPGSPSINANRIISPWFPVGHGAPTSHLKPILTPRAMAVHQRTLDKTKDVIRKQIECGGPGGFPGQVYGEFGPHGPPASANPSTNQEGNDYCVMGEFPEGQKWHPYQNGTNAYHSRGAPTSKISNLHRNMQNSNPHPGHWTQFCGVPLSQSGMIRGPRHMVFVPDQQNHCVFPEEIQLPYGSSKIDINHRLHTSYCQSELQQQEKTISSPVNMQQISDEEKCAEERSKWNNSTLSNGSSEASMSTNLVSNSSRSGSEPFPKEEQDSQERVESSPQQYVERVEVKQQKVSCKQPLPGFHQAFGSTEIGRFSRSEFFSNMVGESSNVTVSNDRGGDDEDVDLTSRVTTIEDLRHSGIAEVSSNNCPNSTSSCDNSANNFSSLTLSSYYNEARSPAAATPRWHSPCVSAIGSEI